MRSDSTYNNQTKGKSEKLGPLQIPLGKTMIPVGEVHAGDFFAVTKLRETTTGDTLCDPAHPIIFKSVEVPEPSITFAIEPKSRGDEDKISNALARITEEDAAIKYNRDPQTKQLLLSGSGQLHVEVTVAKLRKRYGVDVILKTPKVPYRETIRGKADVQGRHKKQTGGHGQFGDCWIKMEPLPRGGKFEFVDEIFGGSIPRNFIPAVEKGIVEAAARGYLAGYPVVDFRVTLYDGSYHPVDSSEMAFKTAGSIAFKKAMEAANPVLLEPIMNVEIYRSTGICRRAYRRPQQPARETPGNGYQAGHADHQSAGSDVGNGLLRPRSHIGDRRTRQLSHGILPLRRGPGAHSTEDHRRSE